MLVGERLTLRGLQPSDAGSLLSLLTTDEVSRFLSPPPTTIDGFERFIAWTNRKRQEGSYLCFGVVPKGMDVAVGVFQLRALDAAFTAAEWGFALGRPFWGTGLFVEGATHTLDFAFGTVGVQRLEARSALGNGRGNGALRKIGAVHEAVLRRSFRKDGQVHDQVLWSVLDIDWFATRRRVVAPSIQPPQLWH
jgi:RimJ/RimL family protein N-acetyltransferase